MTCLYCGINDEVTPHFHHPYCPNDEEFENAIIWRGERDDKEKPTNTELSLLDGSIFQVGNSGEYIATSRRQSRLLAALGLD